MDSLFEIGGKIAGVAGLTIATLLIVFREIIRKKIFPNLTKDQGFRILRLIIISTLIIAFSGIISWTLTKLTNDDKNSLVSNHPSIKLIKDVTYKLELYPTDKIIIYGGGLDSLNCGLGWQTFTEYNREFMVQGPDGKPVSVRLRGDGHIKMEIVISNHKEYNRKY